MKREYTRPDILFEDFTLSTAIAGTCGVATGLPSANQCGLDFGPGGEIFTEQVMGCVKKISEEQDSGGYNGMCYHVFTDSSRLFSS